MFGQAGFAVLESFRRTLHENFHAAFQVQKPYISC